MKTICLTAITALALGIASCGNHKSADNLLAAGVLADSIANAEANGSVVVNTPNLQASFTITDPEIPVNQIGQELFDVFAAQQLKKISPKDISAVCEALRSSDGELAVIINSVDGESIAFNLTPHRIIALQRAKNSELNFSAARTQVVAIAERMTPNPEAHAGAVKVEASVAKSFLEYNVIWAKSAEFDKKSQGVLTQNYFNALKLQYQALGGLAEPVIDMLSSMGIDGVRIVYSAENSDKQLKQAFPWREIREPIVEKQ